MLDLVERQPFNEKRGRHLPFHPVNVPLAQIAGEPEQKETVRTAP